MPDQSVGYRLRGGLHWDMEQFVEAHDDYTRVLEFEPNQPESLSARGQILAEMGEYDQALDHLNIAAERSQKAGTNLTLAFTLNGRALALAGLNRFEESTRDYERSVQLCPSNPWVYYHRGMVMFQRGEFREAQHLLEMALELSDPPLPVRKKQRARTALDRTVAAPHS